MHIEDNAKELYSNMITLLLAWQIARYVGKSEAAAIKKCARKILQRTKDRQEYEVFKKIAYSGSDFKVVETAKKCFEENKRLGYI